MNVSYQSIDCHRNETVELHFHKSKQSCNLPDSSRHHVGKPWIILNVIPRKRFTLDYYISTSDEFRIAIQLHLRTLKPPSSTVASQNDGWISTVVFIAKYETG